MTQDSQPQPNLKYLCSIEYGKTRRRTEMSVTQGSIEWFVVQLEYNHGGAVSDTDWRNVARFDHHPGYEWGHDITREGLHLDIYSPRGHKVDQKYGFPEMPIEKAPAYCEKYLENRAEILSENYLQR